MISPLFSSSPPYIEDVEYNKSLFSTKNGLFDTRGHGILRVRCKEFETPLYRFAYMPMRNRGEIIRLMLEEAEVPYEVEVIGFKDWEEGVKGTTPQGKCPVLRNYDGKGNDLGQESAITRFLAGQLGLDGESAVERAQMDSLYCLWFSTMRNNGVSHDGNEFSVAALVDAEGSKSEGRPTYQETFRINDLDKAGRSLLILDYFEEQLSKSSGPYLINAKPCYIDFGLFYILFELSEPSNVPDFSSKFDLPLLGEFVNAVASRPQINDYLKSARRMPRYQRDKSGLSLYTYVEGKWSPAHRRGGEDNLG
ncbi:hypothetical protein TrRE_jg10469 [Triparma retinervis]|uniref:Glutathione S-transferase n=1 Tax=Triparma retinervis TaxID=2557542 RepID=A0A9W6ZUG5_9STRA|nr:hypothetical protein TrRE_jg10469 [Triparma retinervis]